MSTALAIIIYTLLLGVISGDRIEAKDNAVIAINDCRPENTQQ